MTRDLDKCTLRCQKLLMRMTRFNPEASHVPGKELVASNALSRNPLPHIDVDAVAMEEVEDYVESIQESWSVSNDRLNCPRVAIFEDNELQWITKYVMHVWLARKRQHAKPSTQFEKFKGDLSIVDGLLIYNDSITIPEGQQTNMLEHIHESHQGLSKSHERAQQIVWWPKLSHQLKQLISNCTTWQTNNPSQLFVPLIPMELAKSGNRSLPLRGKEFCSHGRLVFQVDRDPASKKYHLSSSDTRAEAAVCTTWDSRL